MLFRSHDTARLLELGLIREAGDSHPTGGRPRLPLEIDPDRRRVLGVAIEPGVVRAQTVDLRGRPRGKGRRRRVRAARRLLGEARRLIRETVDHRTLAVGMTVPGFLDPASHRVLFSAAWPDSGPVDLSGLADSLAPRRLVVNNNINGLATRHQLQQAVLCPEDQLLVFFGDGQLGASLLIGGRTFAGCITGANELGHTRLAVDTPRCYCGHVGCLERIFSSEYLASLASDSPPLGEALRAGGDATALERITDLLATGVANAMNFCRVGQVIWATDLPGIDPYLHRLAERVRGRLLRELRQRVDIAFAAEADPSGPRSAAALALAAVCYQTGA